LTFYYYQFPTFAIEMRMQNLFKNQADRLKIFFSVEMKQNQKYEINKEARDNKP